MVHRIRRNEKSVVEGNRAKSGLKLLQSGHWDDGIVCAAHEAAFASCDDYVARFSRNFEKAAALSPTGNSYTLPNPRPDLLLKFAAATVWRYAVSGHGRTHDLDLGPYRKVIEQHLFGGGTLPLEAIVGRSNLVDVRGANIEMGLAPYKRKLLHWTVWHFTIGGFDFYLKTDKRPFPTAWKPLLANDNDPITLPLIDALPIHDVPMFQPIFRQMLQGRRILETSSRT